DRDARPLRFLVAWSRRRLLLPNGSPNLVGDHLVRRKKREREVVVLAQAGVVEDARRIIATLFPAFDGVVVAFSADRQDPFVPCWRRRESGLSFDLRNRGHHLGHHQRGEECGKPRVHRPPAEYTTLSPQAFRSRRGVESRAW